MSEETTKKIRESKIPDFKYTPPAPTPREIIEGNDEVYIKFLKVRNVKSPTRGSYVGNAGIDLYMPEDLTYDQLADINKNIKGEIISVMDGDIVKTIAIPQHTQIIIPSGIKAIIKPTNSMLQVNNKSGVSTKKGLLFTAQVIDSNYTGEIHIAIINATNKLVFINAGEKLIQLIHIPVYPTVPEEIDRDEFEALENTEKSTYGKGERRGDKWQGSDKK